MFRRQTVPKSASKLGHFILTVTKVEPAPGAEKQHRVGEQHQDFAHVKRQECLLQHHNDVLSSSNVTSCREDFLGKGSFTEPETYEKKNFLTRTNAPRTRLELKKLRRVSGGGALARRLHSLVSHAAYVRNVSAGGS